MDLTKFVYLTQPGKSTQLMMCTDSTILGHIWKFKTEEGILDFIEACDVFRAQVSGYRILITFYGRIYDPIYLSNGKIYATKSDYSLITDMSESYLHNTINQSPAKYEKYRIKK